MPKVPPGKEGIYILITKGTLERFRRLMEAKAGGSKYNTLSGAIEAAMEHYVREHSSLEAHTQVYLNPGFPKDRAVCANIIMNLLKRGIEYECSSADLRDAIAELRGSDDRTVERWTERLLHYEFLEPRHHEVVRKGGSLRGVPTIFRILYHPKES